ncbi:hypothetical protein B0A48_03682 [Cryoendolithus antarcticus]|uniref:Uncharacterized protein n=1 Tax=Cryoendolithus antarcticus TaxID=1507870 RepID=A0A1V8TG75_9PEZI|nr:hypothetical protein B0A48_03682 [Cryoendolithus antarcticus]
MSSYFTLPSFARAKKNTEALEKTNPTEPVLKDEDEQFLTKITSHGAPDEASGAEDVPATQITDDGNDGKEVEVSKDDTAVKGDGAVDQVAVPATKPDESTGDVEQTQSEPAAKDDTAEAPSVDSKAEESGETATGAAATSEKPEATEEVKDPPEQTLEDTSAKKPELARKRSKRNKGLELPSQEEAEAATKGLPSSDASKSQGGDGQAQGEKRTWASYIPTIRKGGNDSATTETKDPSNAAESSEKQDATATDDPMARSWVQYASSLVPPASALPSLPSLPASWTKSKDKDSLSEPVYNEDGTINESATKEKQEKEVSVLLDNLSLSSINNRVFSFSADSQKYYDRFTQCLKDVMNGAPTAYEDMDKLMKEAGPTLEKKFESMPPFVQTLVKSLPAKLGGTMGPELLAMASEKPGNDMKVRMEKASKGGDPSIQAADTSKDPKKKQKTTIPGLKSLVSGQGMVASMLRNIVTFLRVRFPFLVGTTNVVMSLAVFILMFVFWYCHKRGKEVRLAKEQAALKEGDGAADVAEEDDDEIEVSDSEDDEETEEKTGEETTEKSTEADTKDNSEDVAETLAQKVDSDSKGEGEKADVLNASEPKDVPLPETAADDGAKGAKLEEAKSVGI